MLQRTRSIVWTLWYLVFLLFGIAFTVAQYQLLQYRDWQGYFIGALGGALFALLLIIGRVLIRTRHGLVPRQYLDRFSPAARTFHLLNLLTGYAVLVV